MISQSMYFDLRDYAGFAADAGKMTESTPEASQFLRPYVLVIHRPSRRGFYLDRQYRHIVDVKNCQEPENPTEVIRNYLCVSSDLPAWAFQLNTHWKPCIEFDSFWLY